MKKRNLISGIILLGSLIPMITPLQGFAWGGAVTWDNDSVGHFKDNTYKNYYKKDNTIKLQEYKGVTYYSPVNNKTSIGYSGVYENNYDDERHMSNESKALLIGGKYNDIKSANFKRGTVPLNDNSYQKLQKDKGMYISKGWAKGYTGEWRYLGYNKSGNPINNPYFPSDWPDKKYAYPWSFSPEEYTINPWITQPSIHKTIFDIEGSGSWDTKVETIKNVVFSRYPMMKKIAEDGLRKKIGVVKVDSSLNVRKSSNKSASVIGNLDKNEQVEILGQTGNWYKIKTKKLSGYVSKDFIDVFKNPKTPEEWWAERLSLQTNPQEVTPIFAMAHNNKYRTLVVSDYPVFTNLSLTKMIVYDSKGNAVAQFTRDKNNGSIQNPTGYTFNNAKLIRGETYTVKYEVYNTTDKSTNINPSILDYSNAYGNEAWSNKDLKDEHMPGNDGWGEMSSKGVIGGHQTKEFSRQVTIPTSAQGDFRFGGIIPDTYYNQKQNLDQTDDEGRVIMKIAEGDLSADGCRLYDVTDGKFVEKAVPGHKFKIIYDMTYRGDNIPHSVDITIHANINKVLPKYQNDISGWKTYTKKVDNLYDGQKISIEGTPFVAPVDNIDTQFQIDGLLHNVGLDNNLQNDTNSGAWKGNYDMVVKNVKVLPPTEIIDKKGDYHFTIKYDVENNSPEYANPYDRDVKVTYVVNNKQYEDTIHIAKGNNPNITKQVTIPIDPAKTNKVVATVHINSDGYNYEDNYNNNIGTGSNKLKTPSNPFEAICPAGVRTHNEWTQKYNVHIWSGYVDKYEDWKDNKSVEFKNYTKASTKTVNRYENENYSIRSIKFKSKYTADNNMGSNGWVDLMTGTTGKIKAGYGFQLEVKVNYNTNALRYENELKPWNNGTSGQTTNPINGIPNLPSELFIKTPEGKIISLSGLYGTNPGLNVSKSGNENDMTWTYTIKPKNTLGVKSDDKIYVGENVKNGVYPFEIYTPEVYGVQTKPNESWLCDHKTMNVEVVGSDTGDISTHITQ